MDGGSTPPNDLSLALQQEGCRAELQKDPNGRRTEEGGATAEEEPRSLRKRVISVRRKQRGIY